MNILKILPCLETVIVVLSLFVVPSAFSQRDVEAQPQAFEQGDSQQMIQTFSGTILKSKGDFVLKDPASSTVYALDSLNQLKQYFGKSVKVAGTFDAANKLIHISNIEVVSAK
jgi:hypothetical protein